MNLPGLFAFNLGTSEILVVLVLGLLLFGRRLPEMGRSLGKGIVEFKKGMAGIEDEIAAPQPAAQRNREPSAP